MTSSFTAMLLSALVRLTDFDAARPPSLVAEARVLIDRLARSPGPCPERAVFLGSGALKVLELTAGETCAQWDSPRGYRHGLKATVHEASHVHVSLHPDPHTARYDRDVAEENWHQFPSITVESIGPGGGTAFTGTGEARADAVPHVLVGQIRAAQWSGECGHPFEGRNLSHIVSGEEPCPWQP